MIAADLSSDDDRARMVAGVGELGLDVSILVNNAGFGGFGTAHDFGVERQTQMIRLNCETLTYLQAIYTKPMVERGAGAVLNWPPRRPSSRSPARPPTRPRRRSS